MLNRKLEMKVIKDSDQTDPKPALSEDAFENRVMWIGAAATNIVSATGGAVVAYVLIDTFRKVAIEIAKR